MQPSPDHRGLGLRILSCRGHFWVHSRYGPMTRSPSPGWFCRLASSVSFPPRRQPKLRGSDSCPGGTHLPLNMPAFRWTHYGPENQMQRGTAPEERENRDQEHPKYVARIGIEERTTTPN